MEARTVNNLPPAGTHDDAICCVLAIELSKKSWIVAVNTPAACTQGKRTKHGKPQAQTEQGMHVAAVGSAFRRLGSIGSPHLAHVPYVPLDIRFRAASI